jgi:7-cyano-7-deazaguanine synthase
MDSAVAAAMAGARGRRLFGLTLDYGQSHRKEIKAARVQARDFGIKRHWVVKLPLKNLAAGGLLDTQAPLAYVTFRNGVFLSLGLSLAEALGAEEIWGGWCGADQAGFPDCRRDFLKAMEKAANLGTAAGRFRGVRFKILSPLAGLSKAQTIKKGLKLGVDFSHTWTCYKGGRKPCGQCAACGHRKKGFKEAGVQDPVLSGRRR